MMTQARRIRNGCGCTPILILASLMAVLLVLAPGSYGLVLHGLESGREYLLPFLVTAR